MINNLNLQKAIKQIFVSLFGFDGYRGLRGTALSLRRSFKHLRNHLRQRILNRGLKLGGDNRITKSGVTYVIAKKQNLEAVLKNNFRLVVDSLDASHVGWWLVDSRPGLPVRIGVDAESRSAALRALSRLGPAVPVYAASYGNPEVLHQISLIGESKPLAVADILSVLQPVAVADSPLEFGIDAACQIEFWSFLDDESVVAPRENRASLRLSKADFALTESFQFGRSVKIPGVLSKQMLDDVVFPVDAVYTWVDGDDPAWIESKLRTESEINGIEFHGEANHSARFRSRDELKYSLRSLEMYAPWFRNIYIVTAGQVPKWLDTEHPKITIVDHRDIYPDSSYLPTFNSNSIISRLHHIEGLSEHYVYINDDVFFGRPLSKDRFFLPSGIAKVSPSNNRRPFGEPSATDEPHLNLTRNMRSLLEGEFGVTISRAIKHTPHPQLRSVHFEMESKFLDFYERTWSSRFRHHEDIVADQLHHYYAQIVGKAVPTNIRYNYINILDDGYKGTMENTLRLRHRDTFCINDAPVEGATPIPDEEVSGFLEQYFPVRSSFER